MLAYIFSQRKEDVEKYNLALFYSIKNKIIFSTRMKKFIWLKIIFTDFLEMYRLNVPSQLRVNGIENIAWPGGSEHRWYSDKKGESNKKSTTAGGMFLSSLLPVEKLRPDSEQV